MEDSLKHIQELLESSSPDEIREGAFLAMNEGVAEVVPLLVKRIEFDNPGVQEAVEAALRKLGGQAVLFAVLPLLRSEDPAVRNIAMDLLREVGKCDVESLSELLKDEDPDLRIFGADILGSTGSFMAVAPLSHALLRDPETNVRYQAAVSLGELGFSEAAESLGKALKDEEWVQFSVIEALTKIGDESSVAALLQAMSKSTELVASSIVDALGKLGYIKAVPLLIKALPEASVPLANKIVSAIVNIVGPRSITLLGPAEYARLKEHLFTALQDEDTEIQDAAISGLSISKGDEEFKVIFNLLATLDPERHHERMLKIVKILCGMGYHAYLAEHLPCEDEQKAFLAIDIMSQLNDPAIVPLLKQAFWRCPRDLQRAMILVAADKAGPEDCDFFSDILSKHKDGNVIKSALFYFGRLGDIEMILQKVLPMLEHPYDDVKEAALEACVAVHSADINGKFREMTADHDALHRMMAYHALGRYSIGENLPYISAGLTDESPEVRRVAVEALRGGCGVALKALDMLEPCLSDESVDVRLAAIDVLGHCSEPETVGILLKAVKDPDPWVRARCAESLGCKQDESVAPHLAELLNDEQPLVIMKTIEAMACLGGEAAFKYLLPMIEHQDFEIQQAAESALAGIREEMGGRL